MKVGDLRVVVTGDGEWRGTFAQFVENNQDTLPLIEIQRAFDHVSAGETWTWGGGAAATFTMRRENSPAAESGTRAPRILAAMALLLVGGLFVTGCATGPASIPKPPLTINIEDGSKWFILPIPERTLAVGDRVCFWAGSWQYATLAQDRGAGVWRLIGSDRLLTPENYAGKMILLPAAQAAK